MTTSIPKKPISGLPQRIVCIIAAGVVIHKFDMLRGTMEPGSVLSFLYARRSVRKYQERAVARDLLLELVRAGSAAPSAMNQQQRLYVLVDDARVMAACTQVLPSAAYQQPAAIVVCGDLNLSLPGEGCDFWIQDCAAATQNILLAAAGLGLGAVWCGIHPIAANVRGIRQALHLPEHIIPFSFIVTGWPAETPEPRTQFDPQRVFWNTMEE
jgi:nitroreductase